MPFDDKPCPCGSGQRTAELAAELVNLKREHEETETIAITTHEICLVLVRRLGMTYDDLRREIADVRRRGADGIQSILGGPEDQGG